MGLKDGIFTGELTLRGGAFTKGEISTISVLEIGEYSLRDLKVTEFMMNYLDRAAERRGVTVIGVQEGFIVAVGQHGVTKDALEVTEEAMKRVMRAFWIFFFLTAFTLFLAPITVPFGLWFAYVSVPRRRRKLIELISAVQAATVNLKEKVSTL